MPALHASDQQKQSTYLPQTRRISMLQAAAARLTVPLQRIRCMTCRYQHHCHLIAPCEYIQAHRQQVMTSNIALSGLLTSNIGMLAAIYTNTDRDCKTITLHYHCVTAANLCLDKSIRHGCCDLQQHSGQVVIGLFACCH